MRINSVKERLVRKREKERLLLFREKERKKEMHQEKQIDGLDKWKDLDRERGIAWKNKFTRLLLERLLREKEREKERLEYSWPVDE